METHKKLWHRFSHYAMTELDTGNSWRDRESSRQRAALLLACALILVWGINFSVLKAVLAALTPSGFLFIGT